MPYCTSKRDTRLCKKEDCSVCYEHTLHKWLISNDLLDHWISNDDPKKLTIGSSKRFHFKCKNKDCSHKPEKSIKDYISNKGCKYCTGTELCGNHGCIQCRKKSIISDLTNEQIEFFKKNNEINPYIVRKGSSDEYIFRCKSCAHKTKMVTYHYIKRSGCQYCNGDALCFNWDCKLCWNNRLASIFAPKKQKQFRYDNKGVSSYLVRKGSNDKYIFRCKSCTHKTKMVTCDYTNHNGCQYCNGKELCENLRCKLCFKRSFASHPMSKYWNQKNKGVPENYRLNCNDKFVFDCPHCEQEYSVTLNNITQGHWCGCIKKKTETKVHKYLCSLLSDTEIIRDKEWEPMDPYRPDFLIHDLKLIVEYDGEQHFFQVMNWQPPKERQEDDLNKVLLSEKQGYSTIRLSYKFLQHTDWESKLKPYIKLYPVPTLVLLNEEDYTDFRALYDKQKNN